MGGFLMKTLEPLSCLLRIKFSLLIYACSFYWGFYQVRTKARIVEGDAGKVICREAERLKPAAVILGTRGRGLIQRYQTLKLQSSSNCLNFR